MTKKELNDLGGSCIIPQEKIWNDHRRRNEMYGYEDYVSIQ